MNFNFQFSLRSFVSVVSVCAKHRDMIRNKITLFGEESVDCWSGTDRKRFIQLKVIFLLFHRALDLLIFSLFLITLGNDSFISQYLLSFDLLETLVKRYFSSIVSNCYFVFVF